MTYDGPGRNYLGPDGKFPHDGTRLGEDLQAMEESDPALKRTRGRLEEVFNRYGSREDHVMPENLQVDS